MKEVFKDPAFKKAYAKTKSPWEFVGYRDAAQAAEYTKNIAKIGAEFKDLLTGKKT